jgi:hypothetical protein
MLCSESLGVELCNLQLLRHRVLKKTNLTDAVNDLRRTSMSELLADLHPHQW